MWNLNTIILNIQNKIIYRPKLVYWFITCYYLVTRFLTIKVYNYLTITIYNHEWFEFIEINKKSINKGKGKKYIFCHTKSKTCSIHLIKNNRWYLFISHFSIFITCIPIGIPRHKWVVTKWSHYRHELVDLLSHDSSSDLARVFVHSFYARRTHGIYQVVSQTKWNSFRPVKSLSLK